MMLKKRNWAKAKTRRSFVHRKPGTLPPPEFNTTKTTIIPCE
jgi:hypothetical protein